MALLSTLSPGDNGAEWSGDPDCSLSKSQSGDGLEVLGSSQSFFPSLESWGLGDGGMSRSLTKGMVGRLRFSFLLSS